MESGIRILVAGINVRHIACSAARAGHKIFAVDGYCDQDLKECTSKTMVLDPKVAEQLVSKCIECFSPDALVLGSGLEELRIKGVRILNNSPDKISRVSDKLWLARWLEKKDYPTVPTWESTGNFSQPVIIKPRKGAGGVDCRLIEGDAEIKLEDGFIIQDFVAGTPASVSVISNGHNAKAIAINEQLIGLSWTGAKNFRYCGNITPLQYTPFGLTDLAESIISELGLVGSNGGDFMLTERGPLILEVNPRFQGSLDTVELSTGENVFQAHLQAFQGDLPENFEPRISAGRAIIYAENDILIKKSLVSEWITDIPKIGSEIRSSDPLISILATGKTKQQVMRLLQNRAERFRSEFFV
ncbi:MAG: ATP-grasp domain-containing protein [Methanotrichaceae archaeon]|nr:ATP-grasp domain-containing protein [Methanotrichaceae archaeon]